MSQAALAPRFFFNDPATTDIYTLSLHDALPISSLRARLENASSAVDRFREREALSDVLGARRSEEHTSELQSLRHLVCRLLLEKKKNRRDTLNAAEMGADAHDDHGVLVALLVPT